MKKKDHQTSQRRTISSHVPTAGPESWYHSEIWQAGRFKFLSPPSFSFLSQQMVNVRLSASITEVLDHAADSIQQKKSSKVAAVCSWLAAGSPCTEKKKLEIEQRWSECVQKWPPLRYDGEGNSWWCYFGPHRWMDGWMATLYTACEIEALIPGPERGWRKWDRYSIKMSSTSNGFFPLRHDKPDPSWASSFLSCSRTCLGMYGRTSFLLFFVFCLPSASSLLLWQQILHQTDKKKTRQEKLLSNHQLWLLSV